MYRIIGADGREYGPISSAQMRQWIAEGRANAATRALAEGSTEWKLLGSLPEFSLLFASTIPQPGTPAVFPTGTMSSPKNTGFATAGMVLGIISLPVACCCYGLPFNLLGLIFSIIALGQINSHPERYGGKGMAIAGLVLCILSIFLAIILLIVVGSGTGLDQITRHGYKL
jgi:hypothetical protein